MWFFNKIRKLKIKNFLLHFLIDIFTGEFKFKFRFIKSAMRGRQA